MLHDLCISIFVCWVHMFSTIVLIVLLVHFKGVIGFHELCAIG
jgi:hypothetical protein